MRLGTPSGFSTMSTGVPSSRNGMSSSARSGDHTLVAVTAGHLVARLDLALHGDEDLDHLHHARRQFVAALQLLDLVDEAVFQLFLDSSYCFCMASSSPMAFSSDKAMFPPLRPWNVVQHLSVILVPLRALRTGSLLAHQQSLQTAIDVTIQDLPVRRRGPWRGVRSLRARSPSHARPCRCRGG
jgi:hypothetical protein